ncbi:MAG TPA: DUF3307 domain-containing protein [Solirubrobacteraceae bacterium]|jgi:hypothetical protein|nr:DUF3307 domain-containing protein [Solirubrobacteraceae bacterium]
MTWGALFVVFFVSHQVGDYVLQTDWQAMHKRGGLGRDPVARRALSAHTFTYTLAYVPAFIWIFSELGWTTLVIVAAVGLPHLVQDEGRLLTIYIRRVKRLDPIANHTIAALVDQALHMVALLGAALLVSALS